MRFLGLVDNFIVVTDENGDFKHIEYTIRLLTSGQEIKKRSKDSKLPVGPDNKTYLFFPTTRIEDMLGKKNVILSWKVFWQSLFEALSEESNNVIIKELELLISQPTQFDGNPRFDFLDVVSQRDTSKDNVRHLVKMSIEYSKLFPDVNPFVLSLLDGNNDKDIISHCFGALQSFAALALPIQLVEQGSFFSVYSECSKLQIDQSFLDPYVIEVFHILANDSSMYPKIRDIWSYLSFDILSLVEEKHPEDLESVFTRCPANWEEWLYEKQERETKYKDLFYTSCEKIDVNKRENYFTEKCAKENEENLKRQDIVTRFLKLLKNSFTFDLEVTLNGKIKEYGYKLPERTPDGERSQYGRELHQEDWNKFDEVYNSLICNNPTPGIIVGHNIRRHDYVYLEKKDCPIYIDAELPDGTVVLDHIWDTLEIELLLQYRNCYKLKTTHYAKEDVALTEELFFYQVQRLIDDTVLYDEIKEKHILPIPFEKAYDEVRANNLLDYFEIRNYLDRSINNRNFFYNSSQKGESIKNSIDKIKNIDGQKLIIAPKYYWPSIVSRLENVYFLEKEEMGCFNEYAPFDLEKINSLSIIKPSTYKKRYFVYKLALKQHVIEQSIPCFALLPDIIKDTLKEKDNQLGVDVSSLFNDNGMHSSIFYCTEPSDLSFTIRRLFDEKIKIDHTFLIGFYNNPIIQSCIGKIDEKQFHIRHQENESIIVDEKNTNCLEWYEKSGDSSYYHYRTLSNQFEKEVLQVCPNPIEFMSINSVSLPHKRIRFSKYQFDDDLPIERFSESNSFHRQYWALQLQLFRETHATLPKVLLLSSRSEFDDAKRFFESIKDDNFCFHSKLNRRLEIIQAKNNSIKKYTIASIEEIIDSDYSIGSRFSFFLNCLNSERTSKLNWNIEQLLPNTLSTLLYILDTFTGTTGSELVVIDPYFQYNNTARLFGQEHYEDSVYLNLEDYSELLQECKLYANKNKYDLAAEKVKRFANNILLRGEKPRQNNIHVKEKVTNEESLLYPYQKEAIEKFCLDSNDSTFLSVVPTGGGKSLIYQALVLYRLFQEKKSNHSLTIVVTPLQALMKDQYKEICDMAPRYKDYFAYLNADTNENTKELIFQRMDNGELSLLFIAPERLRYKSFTTRFESALRRKGVNSIIFDEAHCITEWGLDFRPDYLYAARELVRYQIKYPFLRYMLLSATVSSTTLQELKNVFGEIPEQNITRSGETHIPIKKVITPSFINLGNISDNEERFDRKIEKVYELIFENDQFTPNRLYETIEHHGISWAPVSKILVFTQFRSDAEKGAAALTDLLENKLEEEQKNSNKEKVTLLNQLIGHIDFYHAGMSKIQKNNKYLRFKTENLHKYNSQIEENGKKEEIIDGEPIVILFATKAFGMGMNIKNIHMVIHFGPSMYIEDYLQEVGRACRDENLLENASLQYKNPNSANAYCLYTSNDLDKIKERLNQEMQWPDLSNTYKEIKKYVNEKYRVVDTRTEYLIPLNLLQEGNNDSGDSEEHLLKNLNWYETPIWGEWKEKRLCTSIKISGHYEIGLVSQEKPSSLTECLSFLYDFIKERSSSNQLNRACFEYYDVIHQPKCPESVKSVQDLNQIIRQGIIANLFDISYVCLQIARNEYNISEIRKHQQEGQPLCALSILAELAKEEVINDEIIEQLFEKNNLRPGLRKYLKNVIKYNTIALFKQKAQDNRISIDNYKEKCQSIISIIADEHSRSISFPNLFDKYQGKNNDTQEFIMSCVLFCISLHYIEEAPFSYDCISVKFNNAEDIDGNTPPNTDSDDINAYNLFEERYLLKEHKVQAMRALCETDSSNRIQLIQDYLEKVQDEKSLKEYLGEDQCKKISKELLRDIINGKNKDFALSPAQKIIYDIPEEMNICVKAGAGAGKTRLLVCRVLKYLVDLRCANEEEVLVLAYNNKVKDELRNRISDISRKVSFPFRGDNVMTFHSFAGKFCPTIESHTPIEYWEDELYSYLLEKKGILYEKFKYILVDEFQDMTSTRLGILKELSGIESNSVSKKAQLFVVGDAFQSIYGFDKIAHGDNPDPTVYFHIFNQTYSPDIHTLFENHRSYQEIIDQAHTFIAALDPKNEHNLTQFGRMDGETHPNTVIEIGCNWKGRFVEIRDIFNGLCQNDKKTTMAILFRSNAEVQDAFRWIQNKYPELQEKISVRTSPLIYYHMREYDEYFTRLQSLVEVNIETIKTIRNTILTDFSNYSNELLLEFESVAESIFRQIGKGDLTTFLKKFQERIQEKSHDIENRNTKELTIATIHSVKGLDYDMVVIPENHSQLSVDDLDEERRLMYVGCTRAKKVLFYPNGQRERCVINGSRYVESNDRPITYCDPKPCKVYMDYLCDKPEIIQYVSTNVSIGDPLIIRGNEIVHNNTTTIGVLRRNSPIMKSMIREQVNKKAGFIITAVYKKTREETEKLDEIRQETAQKYTPNNRGRRYIDSWNADVTFVYYIDFEFTGD